MDTKITVHVNERRTKITVYSQQATVTTVVDQAGNVVTTTEPPVYASVT
ncbi:MAG: hypothetical protein WBD27_08100 [Pyrinomonadaceae bacterium]